MCNHHNPVPPAIGDVMSPNDEIAWLMAAMFVLGMVSGALLHLVLS